MTSEELIKKSDVLGIFEDVIYDMEDDCDTTVLQFAKKIIEDMPPVANVQNVKHGRWIYDQNGMDFNLGAWVCSECRQRNNNLSCDPRYRPSAFVGSKYCPNCGAKMGGGIE